MLPLSALLLMFLMGTLSIGFGCGKDDEDTSSSDPACSLSNPDLSYAKNMKTLIDAKCVSCHGGNGPGPGDYSTYAGLKTVINNGKLRDVVVIKKSMPEDASEMTQAQRDSINCWAKNGYTE